MLEVDTITLSLSARILINVEALNMAESVGNVTRHRKAPIVVHSGGRYSVFYVPTASGESIAHHYQKLLAKEAKSMSLRVTEMDEKGYFPKYSDDTVIRSWYHEVKEVLGNKDPCNLEKIFVKASTVADVAGFLYTGIPIRRTSRIRFSYLIPTLDAVSSGAAVSYPQFHVRYAPPEAFAREGEQKQREIIQPIYYIESGSALYVLSSVLIASDIARLEYCENEDAELTKERINRVEAALRALVALMDGIAFGAKRSRYLPVWDVRSMIVSVSKGPVEFVVSPGAGKKYIRETLMRAKLVGEKLGLTIKMYAYDGEELDKGGLGISSVPGVNVEKCETHTEALIKASHHVIELLSAGN